MGKRSAVVFLGAVAVVVAGLVLAVVTTVRGPVPLPTVTGAPCDPVLPTGDALRSSRPGTDVALAPPGAGAVHECVYRVGAGSDAVGPFVEDTWADRDTVTLLGTALDRAPPADGDAALLICRDQPEYGDLAYAFVFHYPSGPSVTVEVRLDLGCRGVDRSEWAFEATNGTVGGRFAGDDAAADTLRGIVMGPEG